MTILSLSNLMAQDTDGIFLLRTQLFDQYSPYVAELSDDGSEGFEEGPFSFAAVAESSDSNLITAGTFIAPGRPAVPLVAVDDDEWEFNESFELLFLLNAAYGLDTYQVSVSTVNDGEQTVSIDLPSADYPTITTFSNFAAAQEFVASEDNSLTWNAFENSGQIDAVGVNIEDEFGNSVFYSGDLDGSSTQVTIPVGTLQSGQSYMAHLEIYAAAEPSSDDDYPGVFYTSVDSKVLRMPIRTTGAVFDMRHPFLFDTKPSDPTPVLPSPTPSTAPPKLLTPKAIS